MLIVVQVLCFFLSLVMAQVFIPRNKYATFYIVAATLLLIATGSDVIDSYRLYTQGIATDGIITNTDCGNHGSFTYTFRVGSSPLARVGHAYKGGLNCADMSVGTKVTVLYSKSNPAWSVAGNAGAWFRESLEFAVISMLGFPALILFIYMRRMRKDPAQTIVD
jgi:hypothetical protein